MTKPINILIPKSEGRTSLDYAGTTSSIKNIRDVQRQIRDANKMYRRVGMPTVSVKVAPRLGEGNPNAYKYSGIQGPYIRIEDAKRFDVYLKANI